MDAVEIFQRGNKSRGGEAAVSARGHGRVLGAHPGGCAEQSWRGSRRGTQLWHLPREPQTPNTSAFARATPLLSCWPPEADRRLLCPGAAGAWLPKLCLGCGTSQDRACTGPRGAPWAGGLGGPRGASPRAGEGAALLVLLRPPSEPRSTWSEQRAVRGTAAFHT